MDSEETLEFLRYVFQNNKIKIDRTPPTELYQQVIQPFADKIINRNFLPIIDLIKNQYVDWVDISSHPDLTLEMTEKYFSKLSLSKLINNPKIPIDFLCQLIKDKSSKRDNWLQISDSARISLETYLEYQNYLIVTINLLEGLELKSSSLDQNQKIKILEKFDHGNDLPFTLHPYLLILVTSGLSHHNIILVLKKIILKKKITNPLSSNCNSYEVFNYYFKTFVNNVTFIYDFIEFYETISDIVGINHDIDIHISSYFAQSSRTSISDLKLLIQKGILKYLPRDEIKYRHLAEFFFQEYKKKTLSLSSYPYEKGKYTNSEYSELRCSNLNHIHNPESRFELELLVQNIRSSSYYRLHYTSFYSKLIPNYDIKENSINYDFKISNDIYLFLNKNIKPGSGSTGINVFHMNNTFFLIPAIVNGFLLNLNERQYFYEMLKDKRLEPLYLDLILSEVQLTPDEISVISIWQPLTPELIRKYSGILDWNSLKFNPVWILYPPESFHRLPSYDQNNFWLWATSEEKYDQILKMNLKLPLCQDPEDSNYIIIEHNNDLTGYDNFSSSHFHGPNPCSSLCFYCQHFKITTQTPGEVGVEIKNGVSNSKSIHKKRLFLPTLIVFLSQNKKHVIFRNCLPIN